MKNERILAYQMSEKISEENLQDIAAAGGTGTKTGTGNNHYVDFDVDYDW